MLHIGTGSLVIHLVDMLCLTEFQKLEHLIYLETGAQPIIAVTSTLSWIGKRRPSKARKRPTLTKGVKLPQWEMCTKGLLGRPLIPAKPIVAQEGVDD